MRNLILASFCVLVMHGCSKETVYEDTLPQLEIIVVNATGGIVSGAEVQLYLTQEDWNAEENIVANSMTDANGSVLFSELEERIYYFYVSKDDKDNVQGISYFENPLKINEIKVLETIIQ